MRDSPLQICIANLNLSNLNDSVQTSSPLRLAAPTQSPATPLEEFVNSPKLARKVSSAWHLYATASRVMCHCQQSYVPLPAIFWAAVSDVLCHCQWFSMPLSVVFYATASDFPCQCQGCSMPLLVIFHATVDDVLCHCQQSSVPFPTKFYAFCVWDRADVFTTVAKNVTLICVCKFICWTLSCCFTFSVWLFEIVTF